MTDFIDFSKFRNEKNHKYIMRHTPEFCKIAHHDREEAAKMLEARGYDMINWYDSGHIQGYIAEGEDGKILAWRGTEEKKIMDWFTNSLCWLKDFGYGKVHYGYGNELEKIEADVRKDVDNNTIILGHSQGGGLTVISKKMLKEREKLNNKYIALEPPMVTDNPKLASRGIVTVKASDPVPRLPFTMLGFRQQENMFYWDNNDNFCYNPHRVRMILNFLADRVNETWLSWFAELGEDHSIFSMDDELWARDYDTKLKHYLERL